MGWLSPILTELNIMSLYQRNMIFCNEWSGPRASNSFATDRASSCGLPLFANSPRTGCKNCNKQVDLGINPKLVSLHNSESQGTPSTILITNQPGRSSHRRNRHYRQRKAHMVSFCLGAITRSIGGRAFSNGYYGT